MKLFVFVEFIPSVAGLATAIYKTFFVPEPWSVEVCLMVVIIGVLLHLIMMAYRAMTALIAFFEMFGTLPSQYANINNIMGRVLGSPGPTAAPVHQEPTRRIL